MRQFILLCLILLPSIQVHAQAVPSEFGRARILAWRPDGGLLAVGTDNGIQLLNGQFTMSGYLNTGSVYALTWSHDGRYLAVASKTGDTCSLEIWQPESLGNIWSAPYCEIYSLDWSATDDWLAFQDNFRWNRNDDAFAFHRMIGQLHVIHMDSLEGPSLIATDISN